MPKSMTLPASTAPKLELEIERLIVDIARLPVRKIEGEAPKLAAGLNERYDLEIVLAEVLKFTGTVYADSGGMWHGDLLGQLAAAVRSDTMTEAAAVRLLAQAIAELAKNQHWIRRLHKPA